MMIDFESLMDVQSIGWLGSGLFLFGYACLSFVADYSRRVYFSLNIIASLFLIVGVFLIFEAIHLYNIKNDGLD